MEAKRGRKGKDKDRGLPRDPSKRRWEFADVRNQPASGGHAEQEDRASVSGLAAGGDYRRLLVFGAGVSPFLVLLCEFGLRIVS